MKLATQSHQQQIKVASPGLILVLVDQSGSMKQPFGSASQKLTKAELAALAVNRVINEIEKASQNGRQTRDRCFVGVITYGSTVQPVVGGWISRLADDYKSTVKQSVEITDHDGRVRRIEEELPVWVTAAADGGTPMDRAFDEAYKLASDWVRGHADCFPPVVINITDGVPDDLQNRSEGPADGAATVAAARRLMGLRSNDGNLLLFNAHLSGGNAAEITLPSSPPADDPYARFLFGISSVIPDSLMDRAREENFNPQPDARGMVFNASPETLVRLLAFGSAPMRH
jgi:hypothetical protein